ncbi:hypothetical protein GLYMA_17G095600v4 [Glycine max]|uniref:Uncharacterized protein n=1 Tax=Glycine max TaxID=3847 RepID=A0A0R0FK69_SOYBN|nr:hypothetical protein JHK85_047513 [Glycine max]KAH1117664.1 hypothetical protein GYH30_046776 [Glycine max]KRH03401.1 hypothetical protein GLYMA_17G095600v4 [Glycine max]
MVESRDCSFLSGKPMGMYDNRTINFVISPQRKLRSGLFLWHNLSSPWCMICNQKQRDTQLCRLGSHFFSIFTFKGSPKNEKIDRRYLPHPIRVQ